MTDETDLPPPGWYVYTDDPSVERFWDGQQWTEQERAYVASIPSPVALPPDTFEGLSGLAGAFATRPFLIGLIASFVGGLPIAILIGDNPDDVATWLQVVGLVWATMPIWLAGLGAALVPGRRLATAGKLFGGGLLGFVLAGAGITSSTGSV